ncbi:glutathione ABC transporter permease GsiD, partial [Klebsiella variicola]|nr:glutathione ABC transporter permease GsiD [Klebsiella variicola]
MRLINWISQSSLNAMHSIRPGEINTPSHEFWRLYRL